MFLRLFHALRAERVPVTPREWLDLLGALQAGVATPEPQALYALARTTLVRTNATTTVSIGPLVAT